MIISFDVRATKRFESKHSLCLDPCNHCLNKQMKTVVELRLWNASFFDALDLSFDLLALIVIEHFFGEHLHVLRFFLKRVGILRIKT